MHQKKLKFVSWLLMSMLCMMSYAQDKIQGTVKDTNGEPMIGVSVLVKGTKTGVITDFDGNFSLPSVDKSSVLVFTYVGYVTKEVKVNGQKHLDVIMNEDTKVLDEVVVIGYGTVNKRDLTGSVASVKGEDLAAVHLLNEGTGRLSLAEAGNRDLFIFLAVNLLNSLFKNVAGQLNFQLVTIGIYLIA